MKMQFNLPGTIRLKNFVNDNLLTNRRKNVTLFFIRVAARFFSGVPHPHLLGVCCPDFQTAKFSRSKT
jgi:hypothetical protein